MSLEKVNKNIMKFLGDMKKINKEKEEKKEDVDVRTVVNNVMREALELYLQEKIGGKNKQTKKT